jgi:hypothetical protein
MRTSNDIMVYVSSILTMSTNNKYNNMYNQSALIRISKQLFPDKNVFQLTKQEQSQVLSLYYDTN